MAAITWSETSVTVNVGETATVNFSYGKELEMMFTVTTSDASVATIATSGDPSAFTGVATITGVSAGTTVTVPGGNDTQDAPLTITVVEADDESYLNKRGLTHFWENIDNLKQDKLTVGSNITISDENVISAVQPTVGNATLTIQKNGTSAGTFTANATSNKSINITVPTKTSDITNDSNFVADSSYVHTDNNYTTTEKNKLSGIAAGAEVNVQANWTQTTTTADDYIKNKPTLATVATSGSYNDLTNKPTVPEIKKRTGATTTTNITSLYVAGDGTTTPMALKTHGDDHTGSFAYVNINEPTGDISEAYIGGYVWDEYEDWWRKMSEKKLALYSDIPTVNNATLTIQKNGTTVKTFTANASSNVTANITVPTQTSELTNNSGFLTSSTGVTSVNGNTGAVTGIQTTSNLVTSVSSSSTNSQYPSAKLFYDTVGDVESVLQTLNSGSGAA